MAMRKPSAPIPPPIRSPTAVLKHPLPEGTPAASYISWYSIYQDYLGAGYNLPMTNEPAFDAGGGGADSGSLNMYIPWGHTRGNQDQSLVIGCFGNLSPFDNSIVIPVNIITQLFMRHLHRGADDRNQLGWKLRQCSLHALVSSHNSGQFCRAV